MENWNFHLCEDTKVVKIIEYSVVSRTSQGKYAYWLFSVTIFFFATQKDRAIPDPPSFIYHSLPKVF